MNLAQNKFSKHNFLFVGQDGGKRIGTCYTYESQNAIWDVKEYDGILYFVKNMGTREQSPFNPIHKAILDQFDITEACTEQQLRQSLSVSE